ncbi:MAG: DUF1844 domain-containing protein [Acidobacteriota bacterium]
MSEQRQDTKIKVTDRRMFTPDGRLRPEYEESLAESPSAPQQASSPAPSQPEPAAQRPPQASPPPAAAPPQAPAQESQGEVDDTPLRAGFQDLVGMLAQTASVYLQDASTRLERRAESLELARMHIDLLVVLQRKTAGNLEPGEKALLDDVLYQLRMAIVEQG